MILFVDEFETCIETEEQRNKVTKYINFKTPTVCFRDTFKENQQGKEREVRGCMISFVRETEKHEWTSGKNRERLKGCDRSVLQRVSLSLSP